MKEIKLLDLQAQARSLKKELSERIGKVLDHGQFIMGPEVAEFEKKLSDYVGVKHGISCSSGTDALLMSLMAYGIKAGDSVCVSTFTFIASGEVIALLGARPIFVDVDPATKNLDPKDLERKISEALKRKEKIKGIIAVDIFGLPADYEAILKIASQHQLFVIEDAAQSFGATYKGKRAGSLAHVGTTSFFPAKPFGAYGDGGAVFTNEDTLAELMRSIRVHGHGKDRYDNVRLGLNARLDTIQAAIMLAKWEGFDAEQAARQRIAEVYSKELKGLCEIPVIPSGMTCAWAQYSIISNHREALRQRLQGKGIPTAIYYPIPLHLQGAMAKYGGQRGDCPNSEKIADSILSLPIHPNLDKAQIDFIVHETKAVLKDLHG